VAKSENAWQYVKNLKREAKYGLELNNINNK
jgi:hypothetical protein